MEPAVRRLPGVSWPSFPRRRVSRGAWRRQPEQKWRLTPERLAQLQTIQDQLLDEAARLVPARIVYATCSLLAALSSTTTAR